jgi:RNase P/RNase MRP subunit POP5
MDIHNNSDIYRSLQKTLPAHQRYKYKAYIAFRRIIPFWKDISFDPMESKIFSKLADNRGT